MEKIPTEEQVKDFLEQAIFKCELGGPTVQKQLHEWIKTLAGQKSKAATLKLPERRIDNPEDMQWTAMETQGWNDCLDAVKALNEGDV